ncbi:MAG TPA: helix-turn-helix transcriptional regulator [Nocardioides sp.]|uniref:helix-turn-helix domain-containing protein n=1 Tax=Nocardioides sp. TaxID=35761 RepID=UPI002E34AB99|nr:helix-turn-helix transcriptional regulator [Nocardioides sp.]HEX3931458.1 helix-turn-helix transcriptional regulator [Nocardioides sp.]
MNVQARATLRYWLRLAVEGCFWTACRPSVARVPHRRPEPYSRNRYTRTMTGRGEVLRDVMLETSTTQSDLSRLSGVRQPSISGFLSGKVELSDDQLDRLLSCMGFRLEVVRRPVVPKLTRSERRSWQLHRRLSTLLNREIFKDWEPTIERNLDRLGERVTGQPHEQNLDRWRHLIDRGDLPGLHRVMTGLDRDSIEMREVSPMSGLLPDEERREVLRLAG